MSVAETILVGVVTALLGTVLWDLLTRIVPWLGATPAGSR